MREWISGYSNLYHAQIVFHCVRLQKIIRITHTRYRQTLFSSFEPEEKKYKQQTDAPIAEEAATYSKKDSICMCVCVCVQRRKIERERKRARKCACTWTVGGEFRFWRTILSSK